MIIALVSGVFDSHLIAAVANNILTTSLTVDKQNKIRLVFKKNPNKGNKTVLV